MGGYHIVMTGDFLQHQPVGEKSLFSYGGFSSQALLRLQAQVPKNVAKPKAMGALAKSILGHNLWQLMDTVVILKEQHRFSNATPGGRMLWDLVQRMWDFRTAFTRQDALTLLEAIQARVVKESEMEAFLARSPRAIVLRKLKLLPSKQI